MVSPKFRLQFDENCIAFIIISTPDMFENAFIPYLRNNWSQKIHLNEGWDPITNDPIDQCMRYHLNRIKSVFNSNIFDK